MGPRYGWAYDDWGGLVPNWDEQRTLRRAQALKGLGLSYGGVARRLAREGHLNRHGHAFTPTAVFRMMRNRPADELNGASEE
jgi:hypothetical protein